MLKSVFVYYVFMLFLFLSTTYSLRFGRIRKRKNFVSHKDFTRQPVVFDDVAMYFTRRTTPWPRLCVTIEPSVETYYNKKQKKEYAIKQAFFRKAKMKKKTSFPPSTFS